MTLSIDESRTLARQIADAVPRKGSGGRWEELPAADFAILLYLSDTKVTVGGVVEGLDMTVATTSTRLAGLARRGFVVCSRDHVDHRRHWYSLTAKGHRLLLSAKRPAIGTMIETPTPVPSPGSSDR